MASQTLNSRNFSPSRGEILLNLIFRFLTSNVKFLICSILLIFSSPHNLQSEHNPTKLIFYTLFPLFFYENKKEGEEKTPTNDFIWNNLHGTRCRILNSSRQAIRSGISYTRSTLLLRRIKKQRIETSKNTKN